MKETCIFFQAPAELPFVIQLYDEYKDKSKITIVVVNVYSNYEFIKSLNLTGANIIFCKWPIKRGNILLKSFQVRRNIRNYWDENLSSITNGEVFFFSASFDWVTSYFIKRFSEREEVVVHYAGFNTTEMAIKEGYINCAINKNLGVRDYALLVTLYFITGIRFDYFKNLSCVSFPFFKYGIRHEPFHLNTGSIVPYKYSIGVSNNAVLLFTTSWDYEGEDLKNYVDQKVCDTIKAIQNDGYKVIAKGHPRLGMASSIEKTVDTVLPNYVPAEFIGEDGIKFVIGINSAAIIYFAKYSEVKVISLLKLIDGLNEKLVVDNYTLLNKMCGDKILYPSSIDELKNILLSRYNREQNSK